MSRIFEAYRALHEQGFIPIFVHDDFESKKLVEGCIRAGYKCIEYTLRRNDADEMIPWIRKNYPDIFLLVGSTLDDEKILAKMKERHPQLLTIRELESMDVDGFVSMIGWSFESIREYSKKRIIIPTASTITEAFQQVAAGAQFVKLNGFDLEFMKKCRQSAAFDFCPIMSTGGMSIERIPDAVSAGAVIAGAGFDVILKGKPNSVSVDEIAEILKEYRKVINDARSRKWPEMMKSTVCNKEAWLNTLPHYHPF